MKHRTLEGSPSWLCRRWHHATIWTLVKATNGVCLQPASALFVSIPHTWAYFTLEYLPKIVNHHVVQDVTWVESVFLCFARWSWTPKWQCTRRTGYFCLRECAQWITASKPCVPWMEISSRELQHPKLLPCWPKDCQPPLKPPKELVGPPTWRLGKDAN